MNKDVKWWHCNKAAWIGLGNWVKAHPFKAVFFTYVFCLLAGCAAAMADYWAVRIVLPISIVVFVILMLIMRADVRKLNLIGLLLACLLVHPSRAGVVEQPDLEPAAAGGTVVGVVVIGGVIFSIWLYRFCQRNFEPPPPPPPPPPDEEGAALPGGGTSAAAVALQSLGSCYELVPASVASMSSVETETVTRTVELSGHLVESPTGIEFRLSSVQTLPLAEWLTFEQFKEGWAKHGLTIDDHFTGEVRFGKNGRPSRPEDVPLSWDWESRTMTYDPAGQGNTHAVIIERSADLRTWEPYLSTRMPLNQPVQLTDVSSSDRMFYRFR